jgi:hypothetical protein
MLFMKPVPHYIHTATQLERYQKRALNYLHSCRGDDVQGVVLHTTGSTGGMPRWFEYSLAEHRLLRLYHFRKICHLNNFNPDLKVVGIMYAGERFGLYGPYLFNSPNTYDYRVPFKLSEKSWQQIYSDLLELQPDVIYTTPSSFLASYVALYPNVPKMNCSVLFSGETLFDDIRQKALIMFDRVIDKMRCCRGGLGFIECRYGTKHIDDELCLATEGENGEIISTDFFNYRTPYVDFHTGDYGEIAVKECPCGLYGRVFTQFFGKGIHFIYAADKKLCNPTNIMNCITRMLKTHQIYTRYKLRQRRDGFITLHLDAKIIQSHNYDKSLNDIRHAIAEYTGQSTTIEPFDFIPNIRNKIMLVDSEMCDTCQ